MPTRDAVTACVTLYLICRLVDIILPKSKSPLNALTLLPVLLSSSIPVTRKSPWNRIRLYFIVCGVIFVSQKSQDKEAIKLASGKGDEEESNEPGYDEDKDQLEEEQEEKLER